MSIDQDEDAEHDQKNLNEMNRIRKEDLCPIIYLRWSCIDSDWLLISDERYSKRGIVSPKGKIDEIAKDRF